MATLRIAWPAEAAKAASVSPAYLAAAGGVATLAYGLRVYNLNDWGFWYDEGYSATAASHSLAGILAMLSFDVHPPLYYLLLKGWMAAAGDGEFALRYFSVAAGLLTVVLACKLAQLLADRQAALAAGLLAALSPLLVAYGQETRMYGLAGLLATAAACLLMVAWRHQHWYAWLAFSLVEAAALYTHYYTALVLVALGLAALAALLVAGPWQERRRAAAWAASQVWALALFAPIAPTAVARLQAYGSDWLPNLKIEELEVATLRAFSLGPWPGAAGEEGLLALAAALAGVAAVLGLARRSSRRATALALLWLALATVPVIYAALQKPMFHPRYYVQAVPAYCLLLGAACVRGRRALLAVGLALVVAAAGVSAVGLAWGAAVPHDDARGVARYLAATATARDIALVDTDEPFVYYGRHGEVTYEILPSEYPGDGGLLNRLNRLAAGRDRLFQVQWHDSSYDAKGVLAYYLRSQAEWQGERLFTGFQVDAYDLPAGVTFRAPELRPLSFSYEGVVDLTGAGLGPGRDLLAEAGGAPVVAAGGYLPVALRWQLRAGRGQDLAAMVLLLDEHDRAVGMLGLPLVDSAHIYSGRWHPGEESTNFYLLSVPAGTPPGDYTLKVFVHPVGSDQRLNLVDPAGRPQGTEAPLATVRVASPLAVGRPAAPPPAQVAQTFRDVDLVSVRLGQTQLAQGGRLGVTLDWYARQRPTEDYQVRLALRGVADGRTVAESLGRPVYGRYATTAWGQGERVSEYRELALPAVVPAGRYQVVVSLVDQSGALPDFVAGEIEVAEVARSFVVPPIAQVRQAQFGTTLALLGFDTSETRLARDHPFQLTLYWRGLAEMDTNYTVFTHLLGPGDVVWGQQDSQPLGGTRPTASWATGEVLVDHYELSLRPGAPAGRYQLEIGLYDAKTMERLPVLDVSGQKVDNRLILLTLDLPG